MTQSQYNIQTPDVQLFDRLSSQVAQLQARVAQLERLQPAKYLPSLTANTSPTNVVSFTTGTGLLQYSSYLSVKAPYAAVTHSTTQNINNATSTTLAFDTTIEDNFGFWASGANTRLTVPTGYAGVYAVNITVRWNANATGYRQFVILKNGSAASVIIIPTATESGESVTRFIRLADGDYVQTQVYQTSGGVLGVPKLAGYSPIMAVARFGA